MRSCTDHLGQTFPSQAAMVRHHGVSMATFQTRRAAGCSLAECLAPPRSNAKPCIGPDGKRYPSLKAMCRENDLSYATVQERIKRRHCTAAQAADPDIGKAKRTDPDGVVHESIKAMCKAWNVKVATYENRRKKGYSMRDALDPKHKRNSACVGPDGKTYPSIMSMCTANGLPYDIILDRMGRKGCTLEEAIDPNFNRTAWTGPDGTTYPDLQSMLDVHHIDRKLFQSRRRRGWSLEQALRPDKIKNKGRIVTDLNGREFISVRAMCQHWHVGEHHARKLIRNGMSAQEMLLHQIRNTWPETCAGSVKILRHIRDIWFLCKADDETRIVLNANQLRELKDKTQEESSHAVLP